MAQEQEYKYPRVCVPQTPLIRKGRTAAEQGRIAPSRGRWGKGRSCLSAPSFQTEAFPAHIDRMSPHDNASSGLFAGKESEKTERKGMGTESPLQARWGELSQRGDTPAPSSPVSGSGIVKQAAAGRPGLKAEKGDLPEERGC